MSMEPRFGGEIHETLQEAAEISQEYGFMAGVAYLVLKGFVFGVAVKLLKELLES